MKKLLVLLILMVITIGSVVPVLAQTSSASACTGTEGLSPGYWKNHLEDWPKGAEPGWGPYACFNHAVFHVGPCKSLIDVLNTGGGGEKAFDRQAVAALLNATSPLGLDFHSLGWVQGIVQDAYRTKNWDYYKNILEAANNMGVAGN